MNKDEFKAQAISVGWKPDAYRHLQHVSTSGRTYRLRLQQISWRLEIKIAVPAAQYSPASTRWSRIRGNYYSATGLKGDVTPLPPEPKIPPAS